MDLYWSENDIPAFQGLTKQERKAAKQRVVYDVWKHWQVWLPLLAHFLLLIPILAFTADFPWLWLVYPLVIWLPGRFAILPFHYYINYHLNLPPRTDAEIEESRSWVMTIALCVFLLFGTAVVSWHILSK